MGCTARGVFAISAISAPPFAMERSVVSWLDTPSLVLRAERPPTDFLGTGAGPMAFTPRRERVVGRGQPAERPARSRGSCSKAMERAHFVMPYFGLFVRSEVNPE